MRGGRAASRPRGAPDRGWRRGAGIAAFPRRGGTVPGRVRVAGGSLLTAPGVCLSGRPAALLPPPFLVGAPDLSWAARSPDLQASLGFVGPLVCIELLFLSRVSLDVFWHFV